MKKVKSILLIKVPYCSHPDGLSEDKNFRTKTPFRPIPSLALAALCAFLEKYKTFDYNLKAVDLNIEAYTVPGVLIDISSYQKLLIDCIKNNQYDVLALSAAYVLNVKWVETAVRLSREYHPNAKIIIGGGYPTLFPEKCLKEHNIDDAVIGEGEATFLHILNKYNNYYDEEFEKKFPPGRYITKNGNDEISNIPQSYSLLNMEDLPPPAWHYLNVEKYFRNSGDKILPIEGSRGCPYRCTYCSTYISWGKNIRYKPVDSLINEITGVKGRYEGVALHFIDDNMSFSKKWIKEFLTKMIDMGLVLDATASNFSVKDLDEEIIDLLAKTGVKRFGIAVETGSKEIQKQIKKNISFDKVREVVGIMKSKKLHVHICWMVGFPNETIKQINSTFDFARELRAHSNQFLSVLPYPGTKLFEEAKHNDLLVFPEDDLSKFDYRKCDYLKSDEWDYEQLQKMIYDANIEMNFLNNPSLETFEGKEYFLEDLKSLLKRLPEHIIAHIIVGYLYSQKNNFAERERHYNLSIDLFKNKTLYDTFNKYLLWDNPVIKDFNQYLELKGIEI